MSPAAPSPHESKKPNGADAGKPAESRPAVTDSSDQIVIVDSENEVQAPAGVQAKAGAGAPSASAVAAAARAEEISGERKIMLEARHINKSFGEKKVLVDLDVEVNQRETLCVVGGSGCGKSTLLRVLCGLTEPDEHADSKVMIGGENMLTRDRKQLERIRARLGMVFQYAALLASYSVFENIALPLLEKGVMKQAEIRERVADVLEKVHLPGTEELMPAELSGGMRKRVGIARAIISQPDVILFDEPTSGLDPIMTATFDALVLELRSTLKLTSVIVSHDLQSVYRVADRVIMLHAGHKICDCTAQEFQQSDDPAVRQFVKGEPNGPLTVD